MDLTGSVSYFGSPSAKQRIEADLRNDQYLWMRLGGVA